MGWGQKSGHQMANWSRKLAIGFRTIRRTAVRNLERSGVSRSDAMKIVGHKTESIYRRYAIADENR
jgi:hypothetical protein